MPPPTRPSLSQLALAATMGPIGRLCLDAGGVVIEASQDRDLGPLMRLNPETANGVCKALSLYWIGMHAREQSFWDWLGTQGAIRTVQGMAVMSTFLSYGAHLKKFPGGDGDAWKDRWAIDVLKPYRVVPYVGVTGHRAARTGGKIYAVGNVCAAIAEVADVYIQVSLGGKAGRHAVSFFAGMNDVSFYDPNYGEYWFPKKASLKPWLTDFMRRSGYAEHLGDDWVLRFYKTGK